MPPRRALPPLDHVARFVPHSLQHRDPETDEFWEIAPSAFNLRPEDEGGLSVTWIEYFGPYGLEAKRSAAEAYRDTLHSKKLGAKGVFATAVVELVIEKGKLYGKALRVVGDPVPNNPAHAEVRHFNDDDLELLARLSAEVFTDLDFVADLKLAKTQG